MKTIKFLLLFVYITLSGACVLSQKEPLWIGKTWQDGTLYYFSGISNTSDDLKEAKEQAYIDAMTKVAEYIGMSINNKTIHSLENSYSNIESQTKLSVQETFLSQATIKEFEYKTTKDNKYIAYVLVEYSKKLLDEEKKRKIDLEAKRQEGIKNRKKLGYFTINISPAITILSSEIKQFLQREGYLIGENGIPITFKLIEERFNETQQQKIYICYLNIEVNFSGKVSSFLSRGYGKDKQQASADAIKQWMDIFKENFDKE